MEIVSTKVGISGVQPRYSTENHESKDSQGNLHCLDEGANQILKMSKALATNHLGKEDGIVLNFQIGDEASFPVRPPR
jgi:hypothetical protein